MTDKLPPNLLALFAPRPPLRWVEAVDHPAEKRKTAEISSIAAFLPELKKYGEEYEYKPTESWLQARDRKKRERKAAVEQHLAEGPKNYKPKEDPNIRGDAFKTLLVARLSYEADERDLEREFGRFGPIERIRIIKDTHAHERPGKKPKPHRGYAFVVFEREKDMRAALDSSDGMRIRDRRVKLDVERGRTVKGWKPRRLGGGLGGRGYTKAMPPRPSGPGGFGAGFRGGFRGFEGGSRGRGGGFRGGRGGGFRSGGGDFGSRRDRSYGPPPGPGYERRNGDRVASGGYDSRGSGRSYDDRNGGFRDTGRSGDRDGGRRTGSNMEPIGRREGSYRDRGFDKPHDDESRKRGYEGGGYEDSRKQRRY